MSDNANASEVLTDDVLDAAFRAAEEGSEPEVVEEVKEPVVEIAEEVKEEPEVLEEPPKTDNAERTRLGRRVANVEKKMDEFLNEIRTTLKPGISTTESTVEEVTFDPNSFVTVADLDKYIEYKQAKEVNSKKAYNDGYLQELANLTLDMEDKAVDEVLNYLEKMPKSRTGNAQIDAKLHLLEAQNNLLRVSKRPANPLEKNSNKENKGISAAPVTRTDASKGKAKVELTPDAKAYIKKMGISEEEAMEMLS